LSGIINGGVYKSSEESTGDVVFILKTSAFLQIRETKKQLIDKKARPTCGLAYNFFLCIVIEIIRRDPVKRSTSTIIAYIDGNALIESLSNSEYIRRGKNIRLNIPYLAAMLRKRGVGELRYYSVYMETILYAELMRNYIYYQRGPRGAIDVGTQGHCFLVGVSPPDGMEIDSLRARGNRIEVWNFISPCAPCISDDFTVLTEEFLIRI
jgi:hypothetical protein